MMINTFTFMLTGQYNNLPGLSVVVVGEPGLGCGELDEPAQETVVVVVVLLGFCTVAFA